MESNSSELVNGLNESTDDLVTKLSATEDKLQKFKALAVKLKKELNDTKQQLSKSLSDCNEFKAQLKTQDREKISSSYQQIVLNFQSLQSEYDKIQDESDSLKTRNKELERDLSDGLNELTRVRQELEETKDQIDGLNGCVASLKEDKQCLEVRKREFESKVIVLQNELDLERKRNVANTGLEQTIAELHHQLDEKTTEIIDLSDRFETTKQDIKQFDELVVEKQELMSRVESLEKENSLLKEDVQKYSETLETQLSEIENYKIKSSEWTALIHSLETQSKTSNELFNKTIKSLETKVHELQTHVNGLEKELIAKDEKFEEYKHRVCKVLKQQNDNQNSDRNSKQIHAFETTIENLNLELNSLKINEFKSENEKLKSLARELQSSLKTSVSPTSMSGNILQEILYSTETQEMRPLNQDFTKHLTAAQNKVENLTQLLEESESNNMLISEQNRVLKEEIRRLERSIERIEMADNLEYLKNIIVKFITLNGEDERQRLIPVLTTILKLSPDEQSLFQTFTSIDQNINQNKWTDYLYNWTADNK
ncbi:unnamed protein product [Oppiella nova]|uniref:GRIP domain-containing protein n=1 Tax=Oppiella nova TaxID=334625 RepID=A0A7R9QB14_9ACAR|nr:unnamed protein product [Oppiella nova]CAG2162322.1 unnamed protein product [Oppiella nova]